MTGRVDFGKNMDFWQQDKWNGFFPVKWHIIKDVPNLQFRHIILENNDNKPVTNSRDTQEVCLLKRFSLFDIYDAFFMCSRKFKFSVSSTSRQAFSKFGLENFCILILVSTKLLKIEDSLKIKSYDNYVQMGLKKKLYNV